jgi:LPS-assembly lipoprotein
MWWSERSSRRTLLGALLPAAALVAACGFTPLYGEGAPASRMAGRVEVPVIDGETGFALRERLTASLGDPSPAAYRLEITLDLKRSGVALTKQDVTTRFDIVGTAEYRLVPTAGGTPAAAGVVRAVTGFSSPESETSFAFASLSAERDAERRLAVALADQILQRLALSAESWS